jgi:methylamine utilization protein MauE
MNWSESLSVFASGLALWPGLFLLAGGAAKVRDRGEPATNTLIARVLPARIPVGVAWTALAIAELLVGALLLAGVAAPVPEYVAAAGLGAAALVALWGMRNAPDAGCGCFGTKSDPVTAWTVVRAGVLCALALVAAIAGGVWTDALSQPLVIVFGLAVGIALLATTPELRPSDVRLRASQAVCSHRPAPPRQTLERLRGSELWADAHEYLAADVPTEEWRDGCFRYLTYPANYAGQAATAVFALYLGRNRASDGVAFVAIGEERVLGQIRAAKQR